jgi:hypothetical protein
LDPYGLLVFSGSIASMTKPPKPEVITDRIERCKREIKRLRLLLKMAQLEQEAVFKPPQEQGARAK